MKLYIPAFVMTLALLGGCATSSQHPSGRVADVTEARVTVTAIDLPNRLVTLKDDAGEEIVTEVAPAITGLDQLKVGDQVIVSYTKAVAWKVRPAGQQATAFAAEATKSGPKSGDKALGSIGTSVAMTATIAAIDQSNGTVTLDWTDGGSDTIKVRDPSNLKKVKIGEVVDILYSEAVAVALRPAGSK